MNNRTIISLVLAAFVAIGWINQINNISSQNKTYEENILAAEAYQKKGLYQKAIAQYDAAISIKDTITVRDQWIEAYKQGYEDDVITEKEFGEAYLEACGTYPQEISYWEGLLELYLSTENYSAAYSVLGKLERSGAESEKLTMLSNAVRYSYQISRKILKEVYTSPMGITTVYDGFAWGAISAEGEWLYECDYYFISPFNTEGDALFMTDKDARLINEEKVVDAIVKQEISKSRAPADNMLPVQTGDEKWQYLDCDTGEFLPRTYEEAAVFNNGTAAVNQDGQWYLTDPEGTPVADTVFDDIKLHENGEYIYRKIIIASVNGDYGVYTRDGERKYDIPGKNADVYRGSYIAYQDDNGKWGFVDKTGEIYISAQFEEARSFSNGLAAVRCGEKWGYIDQTGTLVIDAQFLDAGYFSDKGVAFVSSVTGEYYKVNLRFGGA